MTVKARHPSIYGESKMAFKQDDEWIVMVRWMLWKPRSAEQTEKISF
jgi:hypothetical protein